MKTETVQIEQEDLIINDLYLVGKSKSLGYLPISTITSEDLCNLSVSEVLDFAKENNLPHLQLKYPEECNVYSGAIFFYDENMLLDILHKNKDCLEKAGVPHDSCERYIRYIAKFLVDSDDHQIAYRVIGKTFNDPRFR
ncbi:hypothetical protein SMD22_01000 (plasmid) [Brevibacillus halotolerans]|nr:hypothetical protein SMD22_01000 [Brevibacillus halotolerans]